MSVTKDIHLEYQRLNDQASYLTIHKTKLKPQSFHIVPGLGLILYYGQDNPNTVTEDLIPWERVIRLDGPSGFLSQHLITTTGTQ